MPCGSLIEAAVDQGDSRMHGRLGVADQGVQAHLHAQKPQQGLCYLDPADTFAGLQLPLLEGINPLYCGVLLCYS